MKSRLLLAFAFAHGALFAALSGCGNRGAKEGSAQPPASAASETRPSPSNEAPILARSAESMPGVAALPEDAEAGARSVEQWREHLRDEERERRFSYDRHRQRQHREVIQRLREVRRSYASAKTEPAIRRVQEQLVASRSKFEQSFDRIDHWRVSSTLVPEYATLIAILSEQYPKARIVALSGDQAALTTIEGEISARFERIDEELREAVESEEE